MKPYIIGFLCIFWFPTPQASCSNVVVLSERGEYLVLDSQNMEILQVGNLWWLRIRNVEGIVAGSTIENAGLFISDIVESNSAELAQEAIDDRSFRQMVVLSKLGLNYLGYSDLQRLDVEGLYDFLWLPSSENPTLLRFMIDRNTKVITITQYSPFLDQVGSWQALDLSIGSTASCLDGSNPLVGGLDSLLVLDTSSSVVTTLAELNRNNGLRLTNLSSGCKALVSKVNESNVEIMDSGIIDLAENTVGPLFYRDRYTDNVLFENGTRLLQQRLITESAESGGLSITRTNQFQILDTGNGTVLSEAELDIDQGEIAGKTSCETSDNEKVLIKSQNVIYAIDIQRLSVVASIKVPFDGNYFLF